MFNPKDEFALNQASGMNYGKCFLIENESAMAGSLHYHLFLEHGTMHRELRKCCVLESISNMQKKKESWILSTNVFAA